MKHILIAGASGFVGKYLAEILLKKGNAVVGLGRSSVHPFEAVYENFTWVAADTSVPGDWQNHVPKADVIINLAGASIFSLWTKSYKQMIYDSRVKTTRNLVTAMGNTWTGTMLSASAAGYYGDRAETELSETDTCGTGFLAEVCQDWEGEAFQAAQKGARVAVMRFGVVLGPGGALGVMDKAFKAFLGGPLGSGRHWFPWIHVQDLARAVLYLMEENKPGIYNFTGPVPLRQKAFAKALGRALNRPAFMPAPAFMVKLVMGELGEALLQSQKALPVKLEEIGFEFLYPEAQDALGEIYEK